MKKNTLILLLCGCLFVSYTVFSQDSTQQSYHHQSLSLTGYRVSDKMPFWLHANQYDIVPAVSGLLVQAKSKGFVPLRRESPHWKVGYGINIAASASTTSKFILPELYGQVKYKKWELYIGRRFETFGLCDTLLGTGSYIWSGNALPIPKIQVGIVEYLPLKFTKNLIAFKALYAHGWFGKGDFAYGYFLHQKTLYARIGKPSSRLKLYGGFNHQVQWGGKTYKPTGTVNNQTFAGSFSDYVSVVTGIRNRGNTFFDSSNRVGNHLGSIDIGAEFEFRKTSIFVYRQNLYDDGSLARKYANNIADGLHGFVLNFLYPERKKGSVSIKKVVFELLNTKSQGGAIFDFEKGIFGRDNYFNHQQYYDGWSYKRQIIGTPFITNHLDTKRTEPYNANEIANNNRVVVYHLGIEGFLGEKIHFLSKLSYSLNYGTYGHPYPTVPKQFSGIIQMSGQIGLWEGLEWNAAVAFDQGQLYKNTIGARIGLRKSWSAGK